MEKIFENKEFHGSASFFGDVSFVQPSGGTIVFNSAIAADYFSAEDSSFSLVSFLHTSVNSPAGLNLASNTAIGWSGTANWWAVKDVGISRDSTGVLQINSGVVDTLRDLTLRTLTADSLISTALRLSADSSVSELNVIPVGVNSIDVYDVETDADDFIVLPNLAQVESGHVIHILCNAGANFEIRCPVAGTNKINTVTCGSNNKEYLATDTEVIKCVARDPNGGWVLTGTTALGAVATAVVPD